MSTHSYTARWALLSQSPAVARSSHCVSVTSSGAALLYGGELEPRQPVDAGKFSTGLLRSLTLPNDTQTETSWVAHRVLNSTSQTIMPDIPTPRVGAASVTIGNEFFMWGGRGGTDMSPLENEEAGIWKASIENDGAVDSVKWERLVAVKEPDAPQPRSYHSMVTHGNNIYIHAGCPDKGRLSSLHAFDMSAKEWKTLAPAPEPGRGGTALASVVIAGEPSILRFAGFAGRELGENNELDIYSIPQNSWRTAYPRGDPFKGCPGARSVHGFVGLQCPGSDLAVAALYYGERQPSSEGHAGAGVFWDDVWVLERDESHESGLAWYFVERHSGAERPVACGWFPSVSWVDSSGKSKIVIHGGLLSSNQRSMDTHLLEINLI